MRASSSLKPFAPSLTAQEADKLARTDNPGDLVELVGTLRGRGIPTEKLAICRRCKTYEIRHLLRLHSNLSVRSKDLLRKGRITLGHARALASLDKTSQEDFAYECIDEKWSVRTLEQKIKGKGVATLPASEPSEWASYYRDLGEKVGDQTGYPCNFRTDKGNERAGYVLLRFTSLPELDGIMNRLRIKQDDH